MIESTIYTHVVVLERLTRASAVTGLSRKKIMSWLFKRFADDIEIPLVPWTRIKYQERDMKDKWHRLHMDLSSAEYELLLDLKKACKLSISRIVAYAVEKYLPDLLNNIQGFTDNYRITTYILLYGSVDNISCCVQYWGMPDNPSRYTGLFKQTWREPVRTI